VPAIFHKQQWWQVGPLDQGLFVVDIVQFLQQF